MKWCVNIVDVIAADIEADLLPKLKLGSGGDEWRPDLDDYRLCKELEGLCTLLWNGDGELTCSVSALLEHGRARGIGAGVASVALSMLSDWVVDLPISLKDGEFDFNGWLEYGLNVMWDEGGLVLDEIVGLCNGQLRDMEKQIREKL